MPLVYLCLPRRLLGALNFNRLRYGRSSASNRHAANGRKWLPHQLPAGEHGCVTPSPQQVLNPSLSLSIEEGFEVCPQGLLITRPSEVVREGLPLFVVLKSVSPKSNSGAGEPVELGPYSASGRIPPGEDGASSIHSAESCEDL